MSLTSLLFDPDSFFEQTDVGVRFPLAVLCATALAGIVAGGIRLVVVAQHVDGQGAQAAVVLVGFPVLVAGLFTPFLICLAYAIAIYAIARFFGGTGSFRETVWAVGYGLLPGLFGSLLLVSVTALAVTDVPPPSSAEQITRFGTDVSTHGIYRLGQTLNTVSLVWSGVIWIFATKHLHDVDELDGVVAVGAPVVVTLGLVVFWTA